MSRIRSRNTGIERKMRAILRANRFRYRSYPKVYGHPDFLVGMKTLVFCDGDFWHGYQYDSKKFPKKFWSVKLERNMKRDGSVSRKLRSDGFSVLRLWEHDINSNPEKCIKKIKKNM